MISFTLCISEYVKRGVNPEGVACPSEMSEYECYHELMAVWMRVLMKDKVGKWKLSTIKPLTLNK